MYDTAKLFRTVFVSVFLGLFLADVSLAANCPVLGYKLGKYNGPSVHHVCISYFFDISKYKELRHYNDFSLKHSIKGLVCTFTITANGQSYIEVFNAKELYSSDCQSNIERCSAKKGQKFRDGNFTYELIGKGKGEEVALHAGLFGMPVGTCDDGCAVSGTYSDLRQMNPGKDNERSLVSAINATYTGASCSLSPDALGLPDTSPETPPDQPQPDPKDGIAPGWSSAPKPNEDGAPVCPKGRCPAQVNGMDICVECDATMSSSSTSKKTESTTTPSKPSEPGSSIGVIPDSGSGGGKGGGDGSGTGSGSGSGDGKSTSSEESKSVTKCQGGVCETTTKTKNKDGKGTKETTTTTKQSQSDYCQKNPQDEANCALKFGEKKKGEGQGDDDCKKNPKRIGCLSLGEPSKGEKASKNSQEVRYQEEKFSTGPAGCPAPKTFHMFGQTYKMEFTKFCELAKYFKPLILLAASLAAMFIVINGLKK